MNSNPDNPLAHPPVPRFAQAEETLRLIASLPAPTALEDRVRAALRAAPRTARVLAWPKDLNPQNGWVRAAAAAAIVFVVAGGGWGVYLHVQQAQPARVIVMPPRMPSAGGFSSAGAMRTPQTLPGPTVLHPSATRATQPRQAKKPVTRPRSTGATSGQPATAAKPAVRPAAAQ
jgi:hypothetical protein